MTNSRKPWHTLLRSSIRLDVRGELDDSGGVVLVTPWLSDERALLLAAGVSRPITFLTPGGEIGDLDPVIDRVATRSRLPRSEQDTESELEQLLDRGAIVCLPIAHPIDRDNVRDLSPILTRLVDRGRRVVGVGIDTAFDEDPATNLGPLAKPTVLATRYRGGVSFGRPFKPGIKPHDLWYDTNVEEVEAFGLRRGHVGCIHEEFLRRVRQAPWKTALEEYRGASISRWALARNAIALARALKDRAQHKYIGICSRVTIEGAELTLAALILGKVPVNLNFGADKNYLDAVIRRTGMDWVIATSDTYDIIRGLLPEHVRVLQSDEVQADGEKHRKLAGVVALLPERFVGRFVGRREPVRADETALIMFSSGSTAEPKGIEISHFALVGNCQAKQNRFRRDTTARIFNDAQFFYISGMHLFTDGLVHGLPVILVAGLTEPEEIRDAIRETRVTELYKPPLQAYPLLECSQVEDLCRIRHFMSGGQKVPEAIMKELAARFGVRLMQEFGATENAGCATFDAPPDAKENGLALRHRPGYAGRLLAGHTVKIVDPDTYETLPIGEEGLVLMYTTSLFSGYLGKPELAKEVVRDGWYDTQDLGAVDALGFVRHVERLSRRAKVGAVKVPHAVVEDALQKAAGPGPVFSVTTGLDKDELEVLAVVHTFDERSLSSVLARLRDELPPDYVPHMEHCIRVDEIPLTYSGKPDLKFVRRIAHAHMEQVNRGRPG